MMKADGKASPAYIKAVLFPYNDDLRIADIEKTLSEISSKMSVIFYSCDENKYYTLTSWDSFQKIDKPTESKIPEFDETNKEIRRLFDEGSTSTSRGFAPNRIEKNKNKKEKNKNRRERVFIPPTLDDVENYVREKNLKVSANEFYDYFTAGNWIDSKGQEVKSWKQKLLTWNNYNKKQDNSNAEEEFMNG